MSSSWQHLNWFTLLWISDGLLFYVKLLKMFQRESDPSSIPVFAVGSNRLLASDAMAVSAIVLRDNIQVRLTNPRTEHLSHSNWITGNLTFLNHIVYCNLFVVTAAGPARTSCLCIGFPSYGLKIICFPKIFTYFLIFGK